MSNYTGATPEAPRKTDWRDAAACRDTDPEIFFASDLTASGKRHVELAKATCARCPSQTACLQQALDQNISDGIYGGLNEYERWRLRRREVRNARREVRNPRGAKKPPPATLRELFDQHTSPTTGGHLMWTGAKTPEFRKRQLTPNQIAFILDRGYEPNGTVHRLCDVRGCVQALHLADTQERRQRAAAKAAAKAAA